MKFHIVPIIIVICIFSSVITYGENKIKKGWSVTPFPSITYNSDQGLELGALLEFMDYGKGNIFPKYRHKLDIEGSWYTKGSMHFHTFYDSEYLIEGIRVTASASYKRSTMYQFMGFNGSASPWFNEFDANKYSHIAMYSVNRSMTRAFVLFQGEIYKNLGWVAGVTYRHFKYLPISSKTYEEHKENTLYNKYIEAGIIEQEEANGGSHLEFKAGITYDSRDFEPSPEKGIRAEAYIFGSPRIFNKYDYYKLSLHFNHYLSIVKHRLIFAYHLGYQGTIGGNPPFYIQQAINTLYLKQVDSDGIGGRITVRGVLQNRLVGNGMVWANAEFRIRMFDFKFIKKEWSLSINPFIDAGTVIQQYRLDRMERFSKTIKGNANSSLKNKEGKTLKEWELIYSNQDERIHFSAGAGLKLSMDRNFIISAEYAAPFSKADGPGGLYIGLNYIF